MILYWWEMEWTVPKKCWDKLLPVWKEWIWTCTQTVHKNQLQMALRFKCNRQRMQGSWVPHTHPSSHPHLYSYFTATIKPHSFRVSRQSMHSWISSQGNLELVESFKKWKQILPPWCSSIPCKSTLKKMWPSLPFLRQDFH